MMKKRVRILGGFGVISLLSYTAMVVFSPLAYPGYDWLSMAVSDLSAEGGALRRACKSTECIIWTVRIGFHHGGLCWRCRQ